MLDPALKWLGGKRWLLPRLRELYAPHRHRRLVEPFVGSMAVALGLAPERALLADANKALVWFHQRVRRGDAFTVEMVNDEAHYYAQRDRMNDWLRQEVADRAQVGELFYYLNRTCFNGVCRFNRSGEFNVPFGKYKTVNYRHQFPEYAATMVDWEIRLLEFHATLALLAPDDFVYVDPPYDGTFSDYSSGGFDWEEQERLAVELAEHSGPVVASNSASSRVLEMYADLGYHVSVIDAPRSVAANGDRKNAREMLATRNIGVDSITVLDLKVSVANFNSESVSNSVSQGESEMANLPKGWGNRVANADATIQRQNLRHGEYILEHRVVVDKETQSGPAIIIEHEVITSKPTVEGVEPMQPGTKWGYFLADYGKAKVMLMPNMKAYVLGLLGIDEKAKLAELRAQGLDAEQAKVQFAKTLGETIDAIVDERNMARGMYIKGITFGTKTDDGGDYTGMNWFPVPGENIPTAPSVIARRAASAGAAADAIAAAAGKKPAEQTVSAPPPPPPAQSNPSAVPPPPPAGNLPPPPPAADPLDTYRSQGWKDYPGYPDHMYLGQVVKTKADLIAGR